jgi:hypothetical protein
MPTPAFAPVERPVVCGVTDGEGLGVPDGDATAPELNGFGESELDAGDGDGVGVAVVTRLAIVPLIIPTNWLGNVTESRFGFAQHALVSPQHHCVELFFPSHGVIIPVPEGPRESRQMSMQFPLSMSLSVQCSSQYVAIASPW